MTGTGLTRRALLGGALGLAALPAWPASRCTEVGDWIPPTWLLDDLPRQMQALGVPALGIAAVEDGRVVFARVLGVTHALDATPATDATLFEVASLSKPVFAYAVLQLVDAGLLDLDQPLVHYRRPEYLGSGPWIDAITARDVLRHSTGLPDWRKDPARERLQPAVAPGRRIDYSGEAYTWLQLVMETITGESLDQSMRRLLFAPASMRGASFAWDEVMAAHSVHGHGTPEDMAQRGMPPQLLREQLGAALPVARAWGRPIADWRYADAVRALPQVQAAAPGLVHWAGDILANAAASLRCTVHDYARFMALMVHAHPAAWELRPATRRLMLDRQIGVPGRWTDKTLGFNRELTRAGPVIYHSGSNGNIFKTFALGDAARRRALVVLTNATQGNLLYRRVVRASTGLDLLAFDL